jgi:hypothetical protein
MSNASAPLDRGASLTGLLTVVAANLLYLSGLPAILDPMMSMEPFYIDMAQRNVTDILRVDPAWGPLYALWLKPLRALLGDPVAVYTANIFALSLGVSLFIYLHLLLATRRAAPAAGAALFFLICDFNVPLPSKVNGFALMVILAALSLSHIVRGGARRTAVAALGALLASYARPELYPAAICLCVAAFWYARREERAAALWPAATLALLLALGLAIGTPIFSPYHRDDRLLAAFREHFAWNWGRWHGGWRAYLTVWQQEFGDAQSIYAAIRNNPAAVAHHVADNAVGTLKYLVGAAFDHYPVLAPVTRPALVEAENLIAAAVVFASLLLVAIRTPLRRSMLERYEQVLLPYALVTVFSLASATLIFPRSHYLSIPAVLAMLTGSLATTVILADPPSFSWRRRTLAALVCLAAVPKPFALPSAYVVAGAPFKGRLAITRPVTDTIDFIRSLHLPAPVHVLTLNDGIGEMLGAGFQEIKVWQRGPQALEAYIRDKHVDVIVTLEPGQESFLVDDPYWKVIQFTPEEAGFTPRAVPGNESVRVWVRSELVMERTAPQG